MVLKNKNGEVGLGHNVTFDISNAIPDNFFAPYFEVNSIEEARLITKAVLEQQNNYEQIELFESTFNKIIESKKIDLSKKLFLSIYKPDRLKILTN